MNDIIQRTVTQVRNIAFLYHDDDYKWKEEIKKSLVQMRRDGLISIIEQSHTMPRLDIIIIIVSRASMSDDKIITAINYALEHQSGDQRIIPVIVEKTDFGGHRLQKIQGLPRNGKPIGEWRYQSHAYAEIAEGIREIVKG